MAKCKKCGIEVVWMKTKNGRFIPVDAKYAFTEEAEKTEDGICIFDKAIGHITHFDTCSQREDNVALPATIREAYLVFSLTENAHPEAVTAVYQVLHRLYNPAHDPRYNTSKTQELDEAYLVVLREAQERLAGGLL